MCVTLPYTQLQPTYIQTCSNIVGKYVCALKVDRIIESGHNTSGCAVVGDKCTVVEGRIERGTVALEKGIMQVTTVTVLHALNCIKSVCKMCIGFSSFREIVDGLGVPVYWCSVTLDLLLVLKDSYTACSMRNECSSLWQG